MTLTIELTPESEARLNRAARRAGVRPEEFARRLIEALPTTAEIDEQKTYTARDLLTMPAIERSKYLRTAAERAAIMYEADLALTEADRELTVFSAVSGSDFLDCATHD